MTETRAKFAHEDHAGTKTGWYPWVVVAILSLAAIVSFVDRQIINLLVEPIKAEFGVNDTQIGLLQGLSFVFFYALFALPLARIADGGNRTRMILYGVICWSLATLGCGMATTFVALFVARMFVGVGEATLTPSGYSIISDYFPPAKIPLAISLFTSANFIGAGLAYVVGGQIIGYLTKVGPVEVAGFGIFAPWQMAFILAAVPAILLIFLILLIKEPIRKQAAGSTETSAPTLKATFSHVMVHRKVFLSLFIGLSLVAAGNFGVNVWAPTYFIRVHGLSPAETGAMLGSIITLASAGGVFAGGAIASVLMKRGYKAANILVPIMAVSIALPFILSLTMASSASTAMAMLTPVLFFGSMPFGCGTAALPLISPNRMRAQIVAIYLLFANLIGFTAGPTAVGALTDYVFVDPSSVGQSLSIAVSLFYISGAALLWFSLPHYRALVGGDPDQRTRIMPAS